MSATTVYYESGAIGAGSWTEETKKIKVRIVDSLNRPRYAEIKLSDTDHAIQNAGVYIPYQRIKIVDSYTLGVLFIGRVEFAESENDEALGPVYKIIARDYLQEFEECIIDSDLSGNHNTCGLLLKAIADYYRYTELAYTGAAGFTEGNWVGIGGPPATSKAKVVYDEIVLNKLVLTEVDDPTGQFINGANISEYNSIDCEAGDATGNTCVQSGALIVNVDTSSVEVAATSGVIDTSQGDFSNSSLKALKAMEYTCLHMEPYDYYVDNGTADAHWPVVLRNFARGSLPSGALGAQWAATPQTTGLTIEYGALPRGNQIIPMLSDYKFPEPKREMLTHVKVLGVGPDNNVISSEDFAGATALLYKISKSRITQRLDVQNQADLDSICQNILLMTYNAVQRGEVSVPYYPYHWYLGTLTVVRAGQEVHIHCPQVSAVHNSNMIVVEIDFEDPPGTARIKLLGENYGMGLPEYTYAPTYNTEGTEVYDKSVDIRNIDMAYTPALMPITVDIQFSATDWDDISWGAGNILTANGATYAIDAGTLNLANDNVYYIYYDINDTALSSTQTFASSISDTRVLVAFAKRGDQAIAGPPIVPEVKALIVAARGSNKFVEYLVSNLSAITSDIGLLTAGEIRLGNGNVPGSNFTGLRMYKSSTTYRLEGLNNDVVQAYFDSDGKLYAGAGNVKLDASGILVKSDTVFGVQPTIGLKVQRADDATKYGWLYIAKDVGGKHYLTLWNQGTWGIAIDEDGKCYLTNAVQYLTDTHPYATNSYDLGSSSYKWDNLHVNNTITYTLARPDTDGGANLGSSSYHWSYLYVNNISFTGGPLIYSSTGDLVFSTDGAGEDIYFNPTGLFVLPWADATYYLGATNLRWLNIWAVNVGSAAVKVTNGYFTNLPACPVPTSNTALDVIKKINAPAVSDGLYGVRHYFQDGDFPDEMKMETEDIQEEISEETGKRISAKLVKTGKKEIEFVRTIGVLVQAVRELTEKVEKLESRT